MKKIIFLSFFIGLLLSAAGQTFPGINADQRKQLLESGQQIPLPTYLPAGFVMDSILIKTTGDLKVWDKKIYIEYSKKMPDGTYQSFYVNAGFTALGTLGYKAEPIQSAVGKIALYYQPDQDLKNGKKIKVNDLIGTEWFSVGSNQFQVYVMTPSLPAEERSNVPPDAIDYTIISKAEFKKILQSLKVFK